MVLVVNPCDGTYTVELFATYESLYGRDGIYDWTATPADRCLFVSGMFSSHASLAAKISLFTPMFAQFSQDEGVVLDSHF